jgi:hypothetical protein
MLEKGSILKVGNVVEFYNAPIYAKSSLMFKDAYYYDEF